MSRINSLKYRICDIVLRCDDEKGLQKIKEYTDIFCLSREAKTDRDILLGRFILLNRYENNLVLAIKKDDRITDDIPKKLIAE